MTQVLPLEVPTDLHRLICSLAPRPSNDVRPLVRGKTVKLLEEDHGFQMEREQKLKRGWPPFSMKSATLTSDSEISDHDRHSYTDPCTSLIYAT